MDKAITAMVGGNLADDAAAFVSASHRAEKGEHVAEHVLAFESWEGLARSLARPYRRVHEDVTVLGKKQVWFRAKVEWCTLRRE
jgi:hypothetical protein